MAKYASRGFLFQPAQLLHAALSPTPISYYRILSVQLVHRLLKAQWRLIVNHCAASVTGRAPTGPSNCSQTKFIQFPQALLHVVPQAGTYPTNA